MCPKPVGKVIMNEIRSADHLAAGLKWPILSAPHRSLNPLMMFLVDVFLNISVMISRCFDALTVQAEAQHKQ